MRVGTVVTLVMVAVAATAVALVAVVKSIDMPAYRQLMVAAVAAQTGRAVDIGGTLALQLSLSPRLVATDVRLANPAGGAAGDLLRIGRLEAEIGLLPLLRREIEVRRLRLVEVDAHLERDADGRGNWHLDGLFVQPPPGGGNVPHTTLDLGRVTVEKARLGFRDAMGLTMAMAVDRMVVDAEAGPLSLTLVGSIDHRRFDVSAVGGSIADLTRRLRPFPLKLKASSGGMVATFDGAIARPWEGEGLDLKVAVEATEVAEAAKLLRRDLPALGPLRGLARLTGSLARPELADLDLAVGKKDVVRITAKAKTKLALAQPMELPLVAEADDAAAIARAFGLGLGPAQPLRATGLLSLSGDGWRVTQLKATVGGSDLEGDVHIATATGAAVTATLASKRVNPADFGLLHTTEAAEKGRGAHPTAFAVLAGLDMDLTWEAAQLEVRSVMLRQAALRGALHGAVMRIEPISAELGGGRLVGGLSLDGSGGEPALVLVVDAQRVDLGALLDAAGLSAASGHGTLRLSLAGKGRSLEVIAANLDGTAEVVVDDAVIGAAAPPGDLLHKLAPWAAPEAGTRLNCMVGRFDLRRGLAVSKALLFDTAQMTVGGTAAVDLSGSSIQATLVPRPKQAAWAALAGAVDVSGPLAAPRVTPNAGTLALVPIVGAATADENACVAALRRFKQPGGQSHGDAPRLLPDDSMFRGLLGEE